MNSNAIVAGDRVWIQFMSLGERKRRYETVARKTRTQIVLADGFQRRFYRATMCEIGSPSTEIIGIATVEEIAAFEIEKAARAARETELYAEERSLRRLVPGRAEIAITRTGERYGLRFQSLTAAQVRAMFAALQGVKA